MRPCPCQTRNPLLEAKFRFLSIFRVRTKSGQKTDIFFFFRKILSISKNGHVRVSAHGQHGQKMGLSVLSILSVFAFRVNTDFRVISGLDTGLTWTCKIKYCFYKFYSKFVKVNFKLYFN